MTFRANLSILPPAQRSLWPQLAGATACGFVLYGGTAIALRLGHRQSVDFDFFSDQALDRTVLIQALPFLQRATVIQDEPNAWTLLVSGVSPDTGDVGEVVASTVKLSFFGGVDFGRVGTPDMTDDGVLQVAAMADLMATKVKVILQRIEAKDYIDLAAMIENGESLTRALTAARVLYGSAFQPSESLKAMVYFEGGDLAVLTHEHRSTLVNAVAAVANLPVGEITRVARTLN